MGPCIYLDAQTLLKPKDRFHLDLGLTFLCQIQTHSDPTQEIWRKDENKDQQGSSKQEVGVERGQEVGVKRGQEVGVERGQETRTRKLSLRKKYKIK